MNEPRWAKSSEALGHVVRFGPHAGSHRVALRAAVTVAVPLLLLWATGHVEWSIYAAFGAFASVYGRDQVHIARLHMQATASVMLVASVMLGVAVSMSPDRAWLAVPVSAMVAGLGSWVSDVQRWQPPGPLFLVFAFAACASIPSEPADILVAGAVSAGTALFAVVVGAAGAWWRVAANRDTAVRTQRRAPDFAATTRRHVLRCSLACLLAGSLATGLGIGHPYWAMVSAVVPMVARDFTSQCVRGVQRVLGTLAGLLLAGLLLWADLPSLALICCVIALQAAAELLVMRNYAVALVVVTPLALLMVHLMAPTPAGELLWDRGIETVIGVTVALVLGWLTRRPGPRVATAN